MKYIVLLSKPYSDGNPIGVFASNIFKVGDNESVIKWINEMKELFDLKERTEDAPPNFIVFSMSEDTYKKNYSYIPVPHISKSKPRKMVGSGAGTTYQTSAPTNP